jgi:hypothetical protein
MCSSVEVLTGSELTELLRVTEEDVAALEDSGYTLVGGVKYTTRGLRAEAILMMGPARDRVSTLVETLLGPVIAIGSASNDQRRLVSRNGSFWQPPDWELCNDVPAVGPHRLDEAHSAALSHLDEIFEPRIRSDELTIQKAAAELDEYLRHIEAFRGTYGPTSGFGTIGSDPSYDRRIERWLAAEPPLDD